MKLEIRDIFIVVSIAGNQCAVMLQRGRGYEEIQCSGPNAPALTP